MECRLCSVSKNLTNVFDHLTIYTNLIRSYVYIGTGIRIEENDVAPKTICITCLKVLTDMYAFRMKAIKNDKALKRKYLQYKETYKNVAHTKIGDVEILKNDPGPPHNLRNSDRNVDTFKIIKGPARSKDKVVQSGQEIEEIAVVKVNPVEAHNRNCTIEMKQSRTNQNDLRDRSSMDVNRLSRKIGRHSMDEIWPKAYPNCYAPKRASGNTLTRCSDLAEPSRKKQRRYSVDQTWVPSADILVVDDNLKQTRGKSRRSSHYEVTSHCDDPEDTLSKIPIDKTWMPSPISLINRDTVKLTRSRKMQATINKPSVDLREANRLKDHSCDTNHNSTNCSRDSNVLYEVSRSDQLKLQIRKCRDVARPKEIVSVINSKCGTNKIGPIIKNSQTKLEEARKVSPIKIKLNNRLPPDQLFITPILSKPSPTTLLNHEVLLPHKVIKNGKFQDDRTKLADNNAEIERVVDELPTFKNDTDQIEQRLTEIKRYVVDMKRLLSILSKTDNEYDKETCMRFAQQLSTSLIKVGQSISTNLHTLPSISNLIKQIEMLGAESSLFERTSNETYFESAKDIKQ